MNKREVTFWICTSLLSFAVAAQVPRIYIKNIINGTTKNWDISGFAPERVISIAPMSEHRFTVPKEIHVFQFWGNVIGQVSISDPATHQKHIAADFTILNHQNKAYPYLIHAKLLPQITPAKNPIQDIQLSAQENYHIYFDLFLRGTHLQNSGLVESKKQLPES